ncbi:MAG: 3-hydroxy-5-phosphonooxypentane-2,4-dione thiolase LsrF, partial [Methanoregulaceae archaeon]|nr:3-hydroxy-5-phosphonooxypentane-2,4-dione thiolase LsrF [Methanoregulaceae archaeon]
FSKLVDSVSPTPVVVAGGKYSSPPDALLMAYNSVESGAAGVDFGRNIFQDDNPLGMIKAIGAIVHGNHTVKEAMTIYHASLPGAAKLD